MPAPPCPPLSVAGDGWVRSITVVAFDVGSGHKLECVHPLDSISPEDQQRIKMLAMPDCNTTAMGDSFYCFRTRKNTYGLPLFSSSLLEQTFEYCYCFFRQEKNTECARGFFQKSVVLVSRYPYVNLFERLVKVIGPLYFQHGQAVLEAVLAHIDDWPPPHPSAPVVLPFLGEAIYFSVPDIAMPPQVASKYAYHCGELLCDSWLRRRRELRAHGTHSRTTSLQLADAANELGAADGASPGSDESNAQSLEQPDGELAAVSANGEGNPASAPAAAAISALVAAAGIDVLEVESPKHVPRASSGGNRPLTIDLAASAFARKPWEAGMMPSPFAKTAAGAGVAPVPALRMPSFAGASPGANRTLSPGAALLWQGSSEMSPGLGTGHLGLAKRMTRSGSADQVPMRSLHDIDLVAPLAALESIHTNTSMAGGCYFSSGSSSDDSSEEGETTESNGQNSLRRRRRSGKGAVGPISLGGGSFVSGAGGVSSGGGGLQRLAAADSSAAAATALVERAGGSDSVAQEGSRDVRPSNAAIDGAVSTPPAAAAAGSSGSSAGLSAAAVEAAAAAATDGRTPLHGGVTLAAFLASETAEAALGAPLSPNSSGRAVTTSALLEIRAAEREREREKRREKDGGGGVAGLMRSRTDSELSEVLRMYDNARKLPIGRSPFAEMLLADEARFRVKQGLFQSIGLYSIFGVKLVEHLWTMWELVLTGSPALVVAPNVGSSSAVILGMVSLASPVYYGGDFRPHFTTFDPDYAEIIKMHDEVTKREEESPTPGGAPFAALMLGVINPIFLKMLRKWPNAIVLPGAAGRVPTDWRKLQRMIGGGRGSSGGGGNGSGHHKHKSRESPFSELRHGERFKVQVVKADASLESLVMEGVNAEHDDPIIVMRRQPVMRPDARVLRQLLDPHKLVDRAVDAAESRRQWKDSIRAINDIILRRHFTALTRAFLQPFDPYFRLDTSYVGVPPPLSGSRSGSVSPRVAAAAAAASASCSSTSVSVGSVAAVDGDVDPVEPGLQQAEQPVQMLWGRRIYPPNNVQLTIYSDPEPLLPRFNEEEFMARLQQTGPPAPFRGVRWPVLYRRFINSPNFRPWFTTQRIACVEELREVCREMCLRTQGEELLRSHMAVGSDHLGQKELTLLLISVRGALARESARRERDEELLQQMQRHLDSIDDALRRMQPPPGEPSTGAGAARAAAVALS